MRRISWAAAAAAIGRVAAASAFAQQLVRVRGTIEAVDGPTLTIKSARAAR